MVYGEQGLNLNHGIGSLRVFSRLLEKIAILHSGGQIGLAMALPPTKIIILTGD